MAQSERPTLSAQENFLCLLCFSPTAASIVRGHVEVGLFEGKVYREIAERAAEYLDRYKQPIAQHLPDHFEEVLQGDDQRKARMYRDVILHLKGMYDEGLNEQYCLNQLGEFTKSQALKQAIMTAAEAVQAGSVEEAETALDTYWKREAVTFSPGQHLSDSKAITSFLHTQTLALPTGIEYLDRTSCGPEKGTVLTWIAPTGRGKSWALVHLGKVLAGARQKVLHITLEMSEDKVKARYVQSFFSIARREGEQVVARFEKENGAVASVTERKIKRPTLRDENIEELLRGKAARSKRRMNILVKGFPTNALTVRGLEAYLDALDRQYHFQPDVVLLDYLDLMEVATDNMRLDLGLLFKEFRRVCVERAIAGVTASQTNRTGEDVRVVTMKHLAEDYSKAMTSDRIITYNQTPREKERGLARLYVAKNRDEEDKGMVIISQNYHTGQFCLDSALMSKAYRDSVLEKSDSD